MKSRSVVSRTGRALALGSSLGAIGYAGLVLYHRVRYGKQQLPLKNDGSLLLDRFIPTPEVAEHHRIRIAAPADVVLSTARNMPLLNSPVVRAIIRTRELALGGHPDPRRHPAELVPQMQSIGWVILAERAEREIVMGAVTRPWDSAPVFRSVPAGEFTAFREPGYVKIAWTLRAEPIEANETLFHTETRVATTDAETRNHFRNYWSFVAPGVELIRLAMLRPLKKAAERAAAAAPKSTRPAASIA